MANESGIYSGSEAERRQEVSALVDGELSADGVRRICAAWREDPSARETWHAFSLIGDVMRSEDLASSGAHDARFLLDFRARLLAEPVVLAPEAGLATAATTGGRAASDSAGVHRGNGRSWGVPAAVAAGFLAVIGVMLATQLPPRVGGESTSLAVAPTETPVASSASTSQITTSVQQSDLSLAGTELVFDGQVIRDARLDGYLLAHKQFSGSSVLGAPSGFLRNAAAEVPAR